MLFLRPSLVLQGALEMLNVLDLTLPTLTFPDVSLGMKKTPWDLRPLLFKGGAAAQANRLAGLIDAGALGPPVVERLELVQKIHEELQAKLAGGGSKQTVKTEIGDIRVFFRWADASDHPLNLDAIETTYLCWSDYLLHRVRIVKDINEVSAYRLARTVGAILDKVLERAKPILLRTRLTYPPRRKRVLGLQADKQSLSETFEFGHALLDIVDALTLDAIWGPLPLRIRLRTGQEIEKWSGLIAPEKLRCANPQNRSQRSHAKVSKRKRIDYENDRTLRTRSPLVNLRLEAELLLFIGQTGMNFSQALQLKVRQYSYKSTIDGYEVRDYKHRRQGEVLFEIHSDYKEVFDRYLTWRKSIFPRDTEGLLFPFIRRCGPSEDMPKKFFWQLSALCQKLGLSFIPPSRLRNTRVNWLLRRSRDTDLTSQQAQHSKETLVRIYEEPSLQIAMVEVARFWQSNDPALPSPAPGICDGVPVPIIGINPEAAQPDCIRPTGCLWCEHHRDIDSQDYVWSMASMRHLKILALKGFRAPVEGKTDEPPSLVEMAIERLTAKLRWFRQSNELRRGWVVEALARIDEAVYHPYWHYLIVAVEGD
ncbi:hypothetical protein ANAEL_00295 [Anaerolineales bacterium]|nr:hypothetical protein ANAEL_00295 [Anaerolineales bacterium]